MIPFEGLAFLTSAIRAIWLFVLSADKKSRAGVILSAAAATSLSGFSALVEAISVNLWLTIFSKIEFNWIPSGGAC